MKTTIIFLSLVLLVPPVWADDAQMGAFAIGRGKAAATAAVEVQHRLRHLVPTTGTHNLVDLLTLLDGQEMPERAEAVLDGKKLLEEGKEAYEQLDLEVAQSKFQLAMKKFEYGFGYLDKPAYLVETLMYLGASWVLVGEPDKASKIFERAANLPGRKTLNTELFPPNIIEIFEQASNVATGKSKVSLLSVPEGATLFVDDAFRGGAPLKVTGLRPGKHLVRATKDGFRPWGGKITADANRVRRFKLTLKPTQRRKQFSAKFRGMAGDLIKGKIGSGIGGMGRFLKAQRLVAVVLEGEPKAMNMTGYLCETADQVQHVIVKEELDLTSANYDERLKEYLLKLLTAEPVKDQFAEDEGDAQDGAAAAAKILADGDKKDDGQAGLDLSDGSADEGTKVAQAKDDDVKNEEQKDAQAKEAAKVVSDTKADQDDDEPFAFTWGYLGDKWWFWSAVGVVAVGAATGIYFGATAGGDGSDSKGSLIIGLH